MKRVVLRAGLVLGLLIGTGSGADERVLVDALDEAEAAVREGVVAQAQVDEMADEAAELLAEYRYKTRELARIEQYNAHLVRLVQDQAQRLSGMDEELADALVVQQDIVPLMGRMIDDLAAFVDADLPILIDERRERIARLRTLMSDSGVTTAEKYRLIMDAWQIEMDLGRKLGSYTGTVETDGQRRSVNFLHVGRILLAYLSEDRSEAAYWNALASPPGWEPLADEFRREVDTAMRIADRQATGELLRLPVPAPGGVQ